MTTAAIRLPVDKLPDAVDALAQIKVNRGLPSRGAPLARSVAATRKVKRYARGWPVMPLRTSALASHVHMAILRGGRPLHREGPERRRESPARP